MRHLSIDIETYSSVDLKKSGVYKYVESPDFEILLFAYSLDGMGVNIIDLKRGETIPQWLIDALADPQYIKHAYNATFEIACLSKFYKCPAQQWRCTMVHGYYCGFPGGLGAVGDALGLDSDKKKMGVGMSLIRYFCIPCKPTGINGGRTRNLPAHDPDKWELFKTYCKQDVITEMSALEKLSAFPVPDDIWAQWFSDIRINTRGVSVDYPLVSGALYLAANDKKAKMDEASALSNLENPNSITQLMSFLEEELETDLTDLRKETVAELLRGELKSETAKRLLELRQELSKTSTKKYDALAKTLCADGRCRGLLQFYGANRTGRWAGRLVQVQNLPRTHLVNIPLARNAVKEHNDEVIRAIYGSLPDTLSQLIRTAFVPKQGCMFVDVDFAAIEARVISWLAGETWRLDVFNTHGKIYEASAAHMFGVPLEKISKGNPEYEYRQRGKVAELALGYQGGVNALTKMDSTNALTDEEKPEIVERWRTANRRIVELWYALQQSAYNTIDSGQTTTLRNLSLSREYDFTHGLDFMTILLPSGRKLYYANPKIGINDKGYKAILFNGVDQNKKRWGQLETYGGKLTENVVQAIARDCLAVAIERLEKAGFETVFHVHDEVVIESPTDRLDEICEIMSAPMEWARELPLAADGWIGNYYRKE